LDRINYKESPKDSAIDSQLHNPAKSYWTQTNNRMNQDQPFRVKSSHRVGDKKLSGRSNSNNQGQMKSQPFTSGIEGTASLRESRNDKRRPEGHFDKTEADLKTNNPMFNTMRTKE
jgi:hypothetical protein